MYVFMHASAIQKLRNLQISILVRMHLYIYCVRSHRYHFCYLYFKIYSRLNYNFMWRIKFEYKKNLSRDFSLLDYTYFVFLI